MRDNIDAPLLTELFPIGQALSDVTWESHDGRIRLPSHLSEQSRDHSIHGRPGITFGRQIGAYPILIGVPYHVPLETTSDILVTGHGSRSITGVEIGLKMNEVTQKQLESIPGIGEKSAWKLISERVKSARKGNVYDNIENWFDTAKVELPPLASQILVK
jgi:radical SAM superfamily enzyme with C-terminal helix-hairpin-helix motif